MFGIGYIPFAPGTFGTLGTLPLIWYLKSRGQMPYLVCFLIILALGIYACGSASLIFGESDPKEVVVDEVLGVMLAFVFVDFTLLNLVLGFVVFRLLDIYKPLFIHSVQSCKGATGIILDDLLAGLATGLLMSILGAR